MSNVSPVGHAGSWLPRRSDPRTAAWTGDIGELATLRGYLTHYRLTLELKCQGLGPEQLATRAVPPSNLSLLGLVRHLAYVEHSWFGRVLQGHTDEPRPFVHRTEPDLEFTGAVGTTECVDEAFAAWHQQIEQANAWLDAQTDETMGQLVRHHGLPQPVRAVLVHLIEEYARHCGHADLLREAVDGRTGQ